MTTSHPTFSLSKPSGNERVPKSTLSYFQARNRHRIYDLVIDAFTNSGISQAELARRLGKGTDQICRWLGAPGNWGLDTVSDLMFAIQGAEVEYGVSQPLDLPARNMRRPEWADKPPIIIRNAETFNPPPRPDFIEIKLQ